MSKTKKKAKKQYTYTATVWAEVVVEVKAPSITEARKAAEKALIGGEGDIVKTYQMQVRSGRSNNVGY